MAQLSSKAVISMVVSLIIITFVLPIGLVYLLNIDSINVVFNGENTTLADIPGAATAITLLTTLVPIAIIIGIVLYYMKYIRA